MAKYGPITYRRCERCGKIQVMPIEPYSISYDTFKRLCAECIEWTKKQGK